jgi:prevent-host-death family protein
VKSVSMVDLRLNAEKIIARVQGGERIVLTRRGKAVARLEPIVPESVRSDDPFYSLGSLAEAGSGSLTNEQIDDILYGD